MPSQHQASRHRVHLWRRVTLKKVCVTNQFFNAGAREHARLNDVEVVDQGDIEMILRSHEVRKLDVESLLYAQWDKAA
jgi:hypothetical protein